MGEVADFVQLSIKILIFQGLVWFIANHEHTQNTHESVREKALYQDVGLPDECL